VSSGTGALGSANPESGSQAALPTSPTGDAGEQPHDLVGRHGLGAMPSRCWTATLAANAAS
jgi:hypothetical protein